MQPQRAPVWIFALAASFCAYFFFLAWCAFTGPEDPGIVASFDAGRMRVERVLDASPAARAGILSGDLLVSAGGHPLRTRFDWMASAANWEAGRPIAIRAERAGAALETAFVLERRDWLDWRTGGGWVALALWSVRLAALALGVAIVLRQPRDRVALTGAWFLASASVTSAVMLNGMAAIWRGLPPLAGALLWPAALSTTTLPAIFFTFCAIFPRELFHRRAILALAWMPAVFHVALFGWSLHRIVYAADNLTTVPDWSLASHGAVSALYLAAGLAAIAVNYRRVEQPAERRRLQLLAVGSAAGWLAAIPLIVLDWTGKASTFAPALGSRGAIAAAAIFLGCVLALAYALLRRRVFGIGLLIRQGVRYAMARRVLVSAAPFLGAILIVDLVVHGDQPLIETLRARGWIYAAVGALALLAKSRRQEWLDALDRRFFRERYDARQILHGLLEEAPRAESFEKLAPRVVALIEAAMHPEIAALFARDPGGGGLRPVASAPSGRSLPAFPATSKVLGLVRVLGNPLEIPQSTHGWLDEQLPREETEFLRRSRIELLVPVPAGTAPVEALLALGPKRSEEPYSADDRQLLSAIAAALGLLLERGEYLPTGAAPESLPFEECPECGACYSTGAAACPREGARLTPRPMPRVLAGRYRLERRLGRGGMGAVYEARDVALERAVAAKLMHDELAQDPEAAERFRREARAAAAFSHPNIVTVHDYGVTPTRHAFLIMELLAGNNLRDEVRRASRLTPERTLEILEGVCDAVETAHRHRLVHRDLKPENIFLARGAAGETAKVLDFGVAKSLHAATAVTASAGAVFHTETGVLLGTLQYMSPEQLSGDQPEPGWDIWALAVVAYEMLTGAYPFPTEDRGQWRGTVLAGRFAPLAQPRWQEFFTRAFDPDRQRRPQSARELYDELARAL